MTFPTHEASIASLRLKTSRRPEGQTRCHKTITGSASPSVRSSTRLFCTATRSQELFRRTKLSRSRRPITTASQPASGGAELGTDDRACFPGPLAYRDAISKVEEGEAGHRFHRPGGRDDGPGAGKPASPPLT